MRPQAVAAKMHELRAAGLSLRGTVAESARLGSRHGAARASGSRRSCGCFSEEPHRRVRGHPSRRPEASRPPLGAVSARDDEDESARRTSLCEPSISAFAAGHAA